ncbi:C2 family cysteine protease [Myxococcota bacterium]|nr:C2 family cysteine protease [Myxococcota bacterium]
MLGNSSGNSALQYRTSVGIRGLTTVTPSTTQKAKGKKGADDAGKIDRVVREEQGNKMLLELEEQVEDATEGELAQPAGHSAAMRWIDGDAFRRDVKGRPLPPVFGDVDQGNLGDAWLLSACAAVAHVRPHDLVARVAKNEDGSFTVRLGDEHLMLKPEFPTEGYADPLPNGQRDTLWVALVEKAWAQHEGGSYANLEAGSPAAALEALTGKPAKRTSLGEHTNLDKLWAKLRDAKSEGRPMVLRTRESAVAQPLAADHCYAVLDVIERAGAKLVRVYNPWGTKNNSRPLESMIAEVPLDALREDAEALYVGGR